HTGAGRVFVVPLDSAHTIAVDSNCPELMFRQPDILNTPTLPEGVWVCGCGGGQAVAPYLPTLLRQATMLVLDADALNAIAANPTLQQLLTARAEHGWVTVITPHPLEAARLLKTSAAHIQQDRLQASATLAMQLNAVCVLKGSGTVIAAPGQLPTINPTGNSKLSTAGTGDVLAGMLGAALTQYAANLKHVAPQHTHAPPLSTDLFEVVCNTVWLHGRAADVWPAEKHLTASQLICAEAGLPSANGC
ncbi:MAG: NAD(P)H-hydrate dehydratase, partial [Burkholderiales bacterium]|nr:NAD(P)H-hydrate dehydratase [Burkholderiales bacterium]